MAHASPAVDLPALPREGTEAAARLASIRQALRAADMIAGKSAEELAEPIDVMEVWPALPLSTKRCFTERCERLSNVASAGLATFGGGPLNPAAADRLRDELRESFAHIEQLLARR
jgi:hypothetical protein